MALHVVGVFSESQEGASGVEAVPGLYKHIGDIRASIHDDPTALKTREEISFLAMRIKSISTDVIRVDHTETWAAEVGFVVQELADMEAVLSQHEDDLSRGSIRRNIRDVMEQQQPRHVACLITIWYWVAAWSVSEGPGGSAKELFLKSVESSSSIVGSLLFSTNDNLSEDERKNLHDMLSNLLIMLATSPDHWINVVRHFTENMVETSYTLGVIKKNIEQNMNKNTGTTETSNMNTASPLVLRSESNRSMRAPHTWPTKASQLVREGADRRGPCKPVFKRLVKDAPVTPAVDSLKNVIVDVWHGVENVGNDAGSVLHGISQTISGGEHLIEGVKDLAHTIGNGLVGLFHSIF